MLSYKILLVSPLLKLSHIIERTTHDINIIMKLSTLSTSHQAIITHML